MAVTPLEQTLLGTDDVEAQLARVLLRDGLVDAGELAQAQSTRIRTGSLLGTVLIAMGACRPRDVYRSLAEVWGADYVEAVSVDLDPQVLARIRPEQLVAERWAPLTEEDDGRLLVITARWPTDELRRHIEDALGRPVRLAVSSEWSITRAIQSGYATEILDEATLGLWRQDPGLSGRTVVNRAQRVVLWVAIAVVVLCAIFFPVGTLSTVALVIAFGFFAGIAFKFIVCMSGAEREYEEVVTDEEVAALRDDELPVYTVLVPCYKEKEIVGQLVRNLGALDYPADKLEILLLLEADDEETLEAARASNPPHTITFIVLPDSQPKTKPKACNVGLFLARGEYLVIYDAEDRPDPDQLKKSVAAFRKSSENTVCVQAALNYFNADENMLTRMFTLEYSFWFDYMLPGLDGERLPIPLGGTSNHFRTESLRELGGWDPFNVTEDADLGIRAAARGYRVGVVNSTTYEEANRAYGNWLRQRSRWIKGYMQTVLVHTRHPVRLVRTAGLRQTLSFGLLIAGTPLSFLAVLPLYAIFVLSLFVSPAAMAPYFPGWVLWLSLANLLVGNALMVWVSMMGAFRRRRNWLVLWGLMNPFYWIMHSIASYKGLWQLITRPHYWEKTTHGLSHVDPAAAGRSAIEVGAPAALAG